MPGSALKGSGPVSALRALTMMKQMFPVRRSAKALHAIIPFLYMYCLVGSSEVAADARGEQNPIKVAALGTSLTHSGGWLKPLERHLAKCLARPVDVLDFGRNGATSRWGGAILEAVVHAQPDVVLIEFSMNDAVLFRGVSLSQSRENIRTIVRTIQTADPRIKIFLMTMNPPSGLRSWVRPRIDAYYDAYRGLADELGVVCIDNLRDWKNLTERELRASIPDGVHPVPEWAARILVPAVASAIGGRACAETGMSR